MRSRVNAVRRALEYNLVASMRRQLSFRKKREREKNSSEQLREAIDDCGEIVPRYSTELRRTSFAFRERI